MAKQGIPHSTIATVDFACCGYRVLGCVGTMCYCYSGCASIHSFCSSLAAPTMAFSDELCTGSHSTYAPLSYRRPHHYCLEPLSVLCSRMEPKWDYCGTEQPPASAGWFTWGPRHIWPSRKVHFYVYDVFLHLPTSQWVMVPT